LLGELCFVHGRDIPETEAAARAVLVKRAHDAEAERDRLQGELAEARKEAQELRDTYAWSYKRGCGDYGQ
jgi:hypothetical protein